SARSGVTILACSDGLISSLLCFPGQTMDAWADAFRSPLRTIRVQSRIPCPCPTSTPRSVTGDTRLVRARGWRTRSCLGLRHSVSRHPTPPATYPSLRQGNGPPSPELAKTRARCALQRTDNGSQGNGGGTPAARRMAQGQRESPHATAASKLARHARRTVGRGLCSDSGRTLGRSYRAAQRPERSRL